MNNRKENQLPQEKGFKLWYSYNKYKIPIYFIIAATILFTIFLDFKTKSFELSSHIATMTQMSAKNNIIGFYFFVMNIVAIVQIVNVTTFSKKRSPFSLYLLSALTLLQTILVALYVSIVASEMGIRNFPPFISGLAISSAIGSMAILILGALLMIAGTVFAWIYVDWKYVKVEE